MTRRFASEFAENQMATAKMSNYWQRRDNVANLRGRRSERKLILSSRGDRLLSLFQLRMRVCEKIVVQHQSLINLMTKKIEYGTL